MNLAFIGIGKVGFALADGLQKKGHQIVIAHNDLKSESVTSAQRRNSAFIVLPLNEAIDWSDIIILATPFGSNQEILEPLDFKGKTLIDCTNPVGAGISHGLQSQISGAEKVQEWALSSKVVKCFTIYGHENLVDSNFPDHDVKPVMLIAGNDARAKSEVNLLNNDLGFDTVDTGDITQSLHLEHMTLLWVKMVRRDGHHPNFVWAYLEK